MVRKSTRENRRRVAGEARKIPGKRHFRPPALRNAAVALAGAGAAIVLAGCGGASGSSATATASPGGTGLSYLPLSTLGTLLPAPPPGPPSLENVPVPAAPELAPQSTAAAGQAEDGVKCQLHPPPGKMHIHTHLTIFVNGKQRQIPALIGIPHKDGKDLCFYWLHTHQPDGIIHIEAPVVRTFTLGDFFAVWQQPLGPDQVGPAKGKVTAIVNGMVVKGNPRDIPLGSRESVQLEVGTPLVTPVQINWAAAKL